MKWEYKFVAMSTYGVNMRYATGDSTEYAVADTYGADGWELVNIYKHPDHTDVWMHVYKRPVAEGHTCANGCINPVEKEHDLCDECLDDLGQHEPWLLCKDCGVRLHIDDGDLCPVCSLRSVKPNPFELGGKQTCTNCFVEPVDGQYDLCDNCLDLLGQNAPWSLCDLCTVRVKIDGTDLCPVCTLKGMECNDCEQTPTCCEPAETDKYRAVSVRCYAECHNDCDNCVENGGIAPAYCNKMSICHQDVPADCPDCEHNLDSVETVDEDSELPPGATDLSKPTGDCDTCPYLKPVGKAEVGKCTAEGKVRKYCPILYEAEAEAEYRKKWIPTEPQPCPAWIDNNGCISYPPICEDCWQAELNDYGGDCENCNVYRQGTVGMQGVIEAGHCEDLVQAQQQARFVVFKWMVPDIAARYYMRLLREGGECMQIAQDLNVFVAGYATEMWQEAFRTCVNAELAKYKHTNQDARRRGWEAERGSENPFTAYSQEYYNWNAGYVARNTNLKRGDPPAPEVRDDEDLPNNEENRMLFNEQATAAYHRGVAAYENGDKKNPYRFITDLGLYSAWMMGYSAAGIAAEKAPDCDEYYDEEKAPDQDTLSWLFLRLEPETLAAIRMDLGTWADATGDEMRQALVQYVATLDDKQQTEYTVAVRELESERL